MRGKGQGARGNRVKKNWGGAQMPFALQAWAFKCLEPAGVRCSCLFGAGGALHRHTTREHKTQAPSTRDTKTAAKHKTTTITLRAHPTTPILYGESPWNSLEWVTPGNHRTRPQTRPERTAWRPKFLATKRQGKQDHTGLRRHSPRSPR